MLLSLMHVPTCPLSSSLLAMLSPPLRPAAESRWSPDPCLEAVATAACCSPDPNRHPVPWPEEIGPSGLSGEFRRSSSDCKMLLRPSTKAFSAITFCSCCVSCCKRSSISCCFALCFSRHFCSKKQHRTGCFAARRSKLQWLEYAGSLSCALSLRQLQAMAAIQDDSGKQTAEVTATKLERSEEAHSVLLLHCGGSLERGVAMTPDAHCS